MTRRAAHRSTDPHRGRSSLAAGAKHHRAGELVAAERCYRAVKRRDPDYAEAQRLLGMIAFDRGQAAAAEKLLRRALAARPAEPVYHHTLAEMLRAGGDLDAAIPAYRRAWTLDGARANNGLDLAQALTEAGRSEQALAVYHELIERWPTLAAARARGAKLDYERGAPGAARECLSAWQAQPPTDAANRHALARAWIDIEEYAHAGKLYRALLAADPADARAHAKLGEVHQNQGAFDAAAASFERALAIEPRRGWVYAALVANRGYRLGDAQHAALDAIVDDPASGSANRAHAWFALGHARDREHDYARAFAAFARGNRLQAEREPFDRARFDARIERIVDYFDANGSAAQRAPADAADKPLFVVGMPRSGTSLVEQILARHPRAAGAGELEDIRRTVRELPALTNGAPFPRCLDALSEAQARALAKRYRATLDDRAPAATRVVDKMPFNMLWLGLVARLCPAARVVYCRRAAMDNCLSCYFQIFGRGLRFSYDLGHLGHVYRAHERLMAHWQNVLGLPMLTIDYESLVRESEAETRRLIDFAGLAWDDRCLAPQHAARAVRTASVWQVRQPVYTSSVARWRAYEPWLGELVQALAGAAQAQSQATNR